jgi:hypothetical protein
VTIYHCQIEHCVSMGQIDIELAPPFTKIRVCLYHYVVLMIPACRPQPSVNA